MPSARAGPKRQSENPRMLRPLSPARSALGRNTAALGARDDRLSALLDRVPTRFGDEAACAQYLIAARWPDGFVCPGCGGGKAWRLETKACTYECASCGRQTSVTAGTIMHHSKLPLTAWFWAAYLMATHSNGISALQLQRQLGFGSYKTAWLLCAKLRCSMLAPGRSPLAGLIEVDETEIACRSKNAQSQHDYYDENVLHTNLAFPQLSPPAPPPRRMVGPHTPAPPASPTIPMSSARSPPISRPALGSPHLLQPQSLGLGRLPRAAPQAPPVLPR
jgi:transposase-like protein